MKRAFLLATAGLALGSMAVSAQPSHGSGAHQPDDPSIAHERYTLTNGMEVILHQDNSVPLVAVDVWYHVGSRNELPGRSGFAHLFEHMLFQGAKHIGEDVHFDYLRSVGASAVNGSTTFDRTNYYEVVPSNQLEMALWLESDRMGYFLPTLTEESFKNQIDVVRNERRQNYDNRPYRKAMFPLFEALYPEGHPHRYMVIGAHEHLASSTAEDVRNFYKRWYAPANATLTIAGDFEPEAIKPLIEKYFGTFPASDKPTLEPPPPVRLSETKRLTVEDDFAKLRQIQYVWHAPPTYTAGAAELDILSGVLGDRGTGRLYKTLVVEKQLAQSVSAWSWEMQNGGIWAITVTLRSGADLAEVEQLIGEELHRVLSAPVEQREFDRQVVQYESRFIWGLESLLSRAETLQHYNHFLGQPDGISADLNRYRTSSPDKVLRVANEWLRRPRVEVFTIPQSDARDGAEPKGVVR